MKNALEFLVGKVSEHLDADGVVMFVLTPDRIMDVTQPAIWTAMVHLHQRTFAIRALFDDHVTFWEMPSGYRVPSHLIPILRTALEKHREVKITIEGISNISAVEIMPPPPAFTRLCHAAARLRLRLTRRQKRPFSGEGRR